MLCNTLTTGRSMPGGFCGAGGACAIDALRLVRKQDVGATALHFACAVLCGQPAVKIGTSLAEQIWQSAPAPAHWSRQMSG